jgi:hypothetical protein
LSGRSPPLISTPNQMLPGRCGAASSAHRQDDRGASRTYQTRASCLQSSSSRWRRLPPRMPRLSPKRPTVWPLHGLADHAKGIRKFGSGSRARRAGNGPRRSRWRAAPTGGADPNPVGTRSSTRLPVERSSFSTRSGRARGAGGACSPPRQMAGALGRRPGVCRAEFSGPSRTSRWSSAMALCFAHPAPSIWAGALISSARATLARAGKRSDH